MSGLQQRPQPLIPGGNEKGENFLEGMYDSEGVEEEDDGDEEDDVPTIPVGMCWNIVVP